jgi:uncharacterized protein YodC (DUF2158 family)
MFRRSHSGLFGLALRAGLAASGRFGAGRRIQASGGSGASWGDYGRSYYANIINIMKQQEQFKDGDIVQLKSGGPKMTVIEGFIGTSGWVRCAWFAASKHETAAFPPESLKRPDADEKKSA